MSIAFTPKVEIALLMVGCFMEKQFSPSSQEELWPRMGSLNLRVNDLCMERLID
jgi:hypothetical protein